MRVPHDHAHPQFFSPIVTRVATQLTTQDFQRPLRVSLGLDPVPASVT